MGGKHVRADVKVGERISGRQDEHDVMSPFVVNEPRYYYYYSGSWGNIYGNLVACAFGLRGTSENICSSD